MPTVIYTDKKYKSVRKRFKTYKEVKKNLATLLSDALCEQVSVYRSRRGEWGEWFEHWELDGEKKVITKQGWM